MDDMSKYVGLFKDEAAELLQILNDQLLALEMDPNATEVLEEIFRVVHSLKGMAATLGFDDMAELAHKTENLMDRVRKKEIEVTPPVVNLLFKAADLVQALLNQIGSDVPSEEVDMKQIIVELEEVCAGETGKIKLLEKKNEERRKSKGESASQNEEIDPEQTRLRTTIRVRLQHLDNLTNLVGELVISKARLDQLESKFESPDVSETLDRVRAVLGDLQHEVMQLRMVPVGEVFNRFPRMVRDMAKEMGKEVEFTLDGSDIELDRTILDEIGEPLVHLLRNAVAHGIETPEERERIGKPRAGKIHLVAQREKEGAVIEVSDDGKGIDPVKVRETAVKNGFISQDEAKNMSEEEAIRLVCLPGFTSVKRATALSGRGVGVDAVQAKTIALGGTLLVQSEPGLGTRFIIKLPPSLAIIKALLVRVEDATYAIPLKNVAEVVRISPTELKLVNGKDVLDIHDDVIEVAHLGELLAHSSSVKENAAVFPVVITEFEGRKRGFGADEILSQQDVVIKPLNPALQSIQGLSGATILGDGKVALILDVRNIPANGQKRGKVKGRIYENPNIN